jgi:hypothetical protein
MFLFLFKKQNKIECGYARQGQKTNSFPNNHVPVYPSQQAFYYETIA